MSLLGAVVSDPSSDVLRTLRTVCDTRGLEDLGARLGRLSELVRWDLEEIAAAIDAVPNSGSWVQQSGHHLLRQGGKRLRPMCVALAYRLASEQDGPTVLTPAARALAVAVELVHAATLLHDDVVDLGDQRRGAPAARLLFGNAASIFAGDWLLVDALKRVRSAEVDGTLERLFDIIEEMIEAESIQLEHRNRVDLSVANYFKIVEGKTAALFRWATWAGARAGGFDAGRSDALEQYGLHLGVAFQLVDDLLDYTGDEEKTGKALFADLREGKMTHPVLVARDTDPEAAALLTELTEAGDSADAALRHALLDRLRKTGALDQTRALAAERATRAVQALADMPDCAARQALHTVALATVERER